MIKWLILAVVIIVLIFIIYKFKKPRIDTWNLISGQVGGGKTSSCVCRIKRQLRKYYFLFRNRKIKNDYIILSNFPMGKQEKKFGKLTGKRYIKVWLKKIYCYDLNLDVILLQKKLPQDEVILVIDEFSDVASQFDYNNPLVKDNIKEFVSKFRHYTHGKGYGYIIDQCSQEIFLQARRRISYCYNMVNCFKVPLLPIVIYQYRKILLSDEVDNVIDVKEGTEEVELQKFIFFTNPFKMFDSCYLSDRYLIIDGYTNLKTHETLKRNDVFKLPKVKYLYYNTLKYDNITEIEYINSIILKK